MTNKKLECTIYGKGKKNYRLGQVIIDDEESVFIAMCYGTRISKEELQSILKTMDKLEELSKE